VKPSTAGYSGTPLVKKLGVKPGHRVRFIKAPPNFAATLGELPAGVHVFSARASSLDCVVLFVPAMTDLARAFRPTERSLAPAGMLWVAWPKKASKVPTDLTEDRIREIGLAAGLVDVKVCAIDEVWSGLKFVRRLADR
jgi:hypothetical protein